VAILHDAIKESGRVLLHPSARCWGIDIVGPLMTAQGNYKYAAVAVEYFTK
jgi:hypothetical protein